MAKIKAYLISGKISSNTAEAISLFEKSRFGEKSGEKIFYTLTETLYLVDSEKLEAYNAKEEKISREELLKKFQKIDKNIKTKYMAFKDLKDQGYIVKSALKFGADFRIYDKGSKISKDHSRWLCFVTSENDSLKWQDFAAKNRVAHSTKKNLLIAIVDEENDVTYFEVKWTKI